MCERDSQPGHALRPRDGDLGREAPGAFGLVRSCDRCSVRAIERRRRGQRGEVERAARPFESASAGQSDLDPGHVETDSADGRPRLDAGPDDPQVPGGEPREGAVVVTALNPPVEEIGVPDLDPAAGERFRRSGNSRTGECLPQGLLEGAEPQLRPISRRGW